MGMVGRDPESGLISLTAPNSRTKAALNPSGETNPSPTSTIGIVQIVIWQRDASQRDASRREARQRDASQRDASRREVRLHAQPRLRARRTPSTPGRPPRRPARSKVVGR